MINGKSFQLRFYVLLTSCNPLSIYIYEEGIAFFKIKKSDEEPTDATMDIMNLTAIQSNTMHNTS
jgi:tubulin polyglutamylase TTLL6/13